MNKPRTARETAEQIAAEIRDAAAAVIQTWQPEDFQAAPEEEPIPDPLGRLNPSFRTDHTHTGKDPMNKRETIHQEYLARWHGENPAIIQPAQIPVATLDWSAMVRWPHQAKVHTSGPCSVFRANDGRIFEVACRASGLPLATATVFASEADFFAYRKPAEFSAFHEIW